jgi:hypothetical protein
MELAFRGHREGWYEQNKGNFKDLVILISKYSPIMAQYITEMKIKNTKVNVHLYLGENKIY